MGNAQSSTTQVIASAVSKSLPSSDNYFVQRLGKWAVENSGATTPAVITVDDSENDSDDDVQIVKVEAATDTSSEFQCEITFTEPPRKSLSKKHLSRDRARMSPYYRPSRSMTRNTYMEMLRKHIPSYCSDRVSCGGIRARSATITSKYYSMHSVLWLVDSEAVSPFGVWMTHGSVLTFVSGDIQEGSSEAEYCR